MTEVKTTEGKVLFSFDESKTTLAKEIGRYKNLAFADLSNTYLGYVDLIGADLSDADLRGANLIYANLQGANLSNAKLIGADLTCTDLTGADLTGADLMGADLFGAKLKGANLEDANIEDANIAGAINVPDLPIACPSEGSFVAWKKVKTMLQECYLVKLEIPGDARRSSATSNKCRCDKAFVLDIENLRTGEHPKMVVNYNYRKCVYKVGKMVYPDSFDEDRWNECSHGIHFFVDKQDAVRYYIL